MKKLIALLLCLVMVLGLVACGAKEETKVEEPAPEVEVTEQPEETAYELGTLPLTTEDVTLTIGIMQNSNVEDYETNDLTLWLEEKTGVKLDFVMFAGDMAEAVTQLNLMVAGGEKLPDILFNFTGVDDALRNELGEDGYLIDMNPYFEEYAYWYWDIYNQSVETNKNALDRNGVTPSNGAMYAFPSIGEPGVDNSITLAMINSKWLEAVGAEKPTNVDELYEVLKKFATEDPNGNGVADEIAAIGYDGGYRTEFVDYIINAFVYVNSVSQFNATDGQLWCPYTTDEYRQAMIYLNKLYSEGLILPAYYTIQESSEYKALFNPVDGSSVAGVACVHPLLNFEADSAQLYDYEALPPLSGATELGGYASITPVSGSFNTFITADCENPVLAFQFLDYLMCEPEARVSQRYGMRGRDWEWAEEGSISYLGISAGPKVVDNTMWSSVNNSCWHVATGPTTQAIIGAAWEDDGSWGATQYKKLREIYDGYHSIDEPAEVVGKFVYNDEENEVVGAIESTIKDYIAEAQALFVSGVMDPNSDADWDAYLANLETQGLSQYQAASQSAYTRMTAE